MTTAAKYTLFCLLALSACSVQAPRFSQLVAELNSSFSVDTVAFVTNTNTVTFGGKCLSDVTKLQVTGSDSYQVTCTPQGTWSYTTQARVLDGAYSYEFSGLDSSGMLIGGTQATTWLRDTVPPVISIASLTGPFSGGSSTNVSYTAHDASSGLASLSLAYTTDGVSFTPIQTLSLGSTFYSWTFPLINSTTTKIQLTATDIAGNISTTTTSAFTVQSIAPNAPLITLASSTPTNSTAVLLTVADCTGRPYVLVNEGGQPSASSSGWVPCTTAVAGLSYTLASTTQGSHTVSVWSKDNVGDVSTSSGNVNVIFDNIPPAIVIGSIPTVLSQGSSTTLTWAVTEATVSPAVNFIVSARETPTSSWNQIGTVAASFGPLSNAPFSISWTVPNWVTSNAQVQVSLTDLAGNTGTAVSGTFSVAAGYPSVSLGTVPAIVQGGSTQTLNLSASTATGTITSVVLAYSSDGTTFNTVASWTPGTGSFSNNYSWSVPTDNTATAVLRLTATNSGSNSASANASLTVDSTAPVLVAGQFKINGGATTVSNNNVLVSLQSTDNLTDVMYFCLKANTTTAPIASDSCWQSVTANPPGLTPATTLSLSNFPYQIGFTPETYSLYAWTKDQAGNISTLTNGGTGTAGQDLVTITYISVPPPLLTNVQAASNNSPASPPDPVNDLEISAGGTVYIKWNASGTALPATPISLYYTTDGATYNPITLGIANAQNGSCTVDGSHTGCFVWTGGSPSGTFNVRACATDGNGSVACSMSTVLNAVPFNILAGNMDTGTGTAATASVFFSNIGSDSVTDAGSMVVAPTGAIYFKDAQRGIMEISPSDGKLKVLIPKTGVSTDGTIGTATVNNPYHMALDFNGRLLIFDYNRIRAVNFNTNVVSTVIGGGTQTSDGTTGLQFQITPSAYNAICSSTRGLLMVPLPNGDIWFSNGIPSCGVPVNGSASLLKIYHASNDEITTFAISGTGSYQQDNNLNTPDNYDWYNQAYLSVLRLTFNPSTSAITSVTGQFIDYQDNTSDLLDVNFNPTTGVATSPHPHPNDIFGDQAQINSPSGDLYMLTRGPGVNYQNTNLTKYNTQTQTWTPILGTNFLGHCADGTPATSCSVDLWDAYVTAQGQVYVLDHGQIRTIDSSGNMLTLFGQNLSFGDGGNPLSARFNLLTWIDHAANGEIILQDDNEYKIRSFNVGGTVNLLAGNGSEEQPDTSHPANTQAYPTKYYGNTFDFAVDPSTGDIFGTRDGWLISRLSRSSGLWTDVAGNGPSNTCYTTADGSTVDLEANNFCADPSNYSGTQPDGILGYNGTQVLRAVWSEESQGPWAASGGRFDAYLKLYNVSTGIQSELAGTTGSVADWINNTADGAALTSMIVNADKPYYTKEFYDAANTRWLMSDPGSYKIRTLVEGGNVGTLATIPRQLNGFTYRVALNGDEIVYYCSSGFIFKYDVTTSTETQLPWTVSSAACTGLSLFWDSARNSVVFPFTQYGLSGIAEITDTP